MHGVGSSLVIATPARALRLERRDHHWWDIARDVEPVLLRVDVDRRPVGVVRPFGGAAANEPLVVGAGGLGDAERIDLGLIVPVVVPYGIEGGQKRACGLLVKD